MVIRKHPGPYCILSFHFLEFNSVSKLYSILYPIFLFFCKSHYLKTSLLSVLIFHLLFNSNFPLHLKCSSLSKSKYLFLSLFLLYDNNRLCFPCHLMFDLLFCLEWSCDPNFWYSDKFLVLVLPYSLLLFVPLLSNVNLHFIRKFQSLLLFHCIVNLLLYLYHPSYLCSKRIPNFSLFNILSNCYYFSLSYPLLPYYCVCLPLEFFYFLLLVRKPRLLSR